MAENLVVVKISAFSVEKKTAKNEGGGIEKSFKI
jgi:hypothetical protein